jgi:DNA-binding GntR family transcriptional regulator
MTDQKLLIDVLAGGRPPGREPASRREQVVRLLREAILAGEIRPGERLKQDEVCARFALSPTPVREAFRDLEREGLVRHVPNRGVVVSDITEGELLGMLVPVRLAIESYALPLAAKRMPEETRAELRAIVDRMGEAAKAGELPELNDLDVRFHEAAVRASGSEQALQLWNAVEPRIRLQFGRLAPRHRNLSEIQAEHERLLSALETGDDEAIVAALREHIAESATQLVGSARGKPR